MYVRVLGDDENNDLPRDTVTIRKYSFYSPLPLSSLCFCPSPLSLSLTPYLHLSYSSLLFLALSFHLSLSLHCVLMLCVTPCSKWSTHPHPRSLLYNQIKRHDQFVAFYCKIMLISISYNYCSILTANKYLSKQNWLPNVKCRMLIRIPMLSLKSPRVTPTLWPLPTGSRAPGWVWR